MPKLILRCNYLKNAPPAHLENFVTYIGTREGVEKVGSTTALLPATAKQKELIQDILNKIPESVRMHEYGDYCRKPNRENASEFISQAVENNIDLISKKKNYIDYLANRPGVEKTGTHGLFSNEGEAIILSRVAQEVANHTGVVWTNVISLRREDAERLGYDGAAQWQALLRSRVQLLCENYKIDSRNLRWYAAFHNESHHPHVHLVLYSVKPSEGYLSRNGIEVMRAAYAHDIFRQEFMSIYEKKTQQREKLKEQADKHLLFLVRQMQEGFCSNEEIEKQMKLLSVRLKNTKGKKVYGYLKADVKEIVDRIVNELVKEEKTAECYEKWLESKNEILRYYKDIVPELPPLSKQKEFKSIRNMVVREAVWFGEGYIYAEDKMSASEEPEAETLENPDLGLMDDSVVLMEASVEKSEQNGRDMEAAVDCYAVWNVSYKKAREYLYGTVEREPNMVEAYAAMGAEAERGNAYAMHDMGKIYAQGLSVEQSQEKAQEWYAKALAAMLADTGRKENAYLQYRIGKMYQHAQGTEENMEEAAKWFARAAEQESREGRKSMGLSLYSLGMLYLHGKGVSQDVEEASRLFILAHQKGNPYASFELGKLYEAGRGINENQEEKAENCYRSAFLGFLSMESKSGNDSLWYRIGSMYLKGVGTEKDEEKAEYYLLKAESFGNLHAGYQLARLYLRQESEKLCMELEEAADWGKIKKAINLLTVCANQENHFAEYALGKLYADGILTTEDMDKAFFYLHRAAAAGNIHAQYRLGRIYLDDVYKNVSEAVHFLTMAADQQNDFAQYCLGRLYLAGEDIAKDIPRALHYLEKSAYAGNHYAQYVLGKLYLIGKEVPQDRDRAYQYFALAAEQRNQYAAYFLEHWNDVQHPDLFLMATRFMRQLGHIMEDDVLGKRKGQRGGIDRKLARKIREKKIAQGHVEEEQDGRFYLFY